MKIKEYYDKKRRDWYNSDIDMGSVKDQHKENVAKLKEVEQERQGDDRPINIVVLHGSGRHPVESCAHELSNTALFLERSLELSLEETEHSTRIRTHTLREYILDPCNGCYSSASALCNFPCTCFPGDDITTKIYPDIMWADIMLFSTPVNQSSISTRLKTVIDRLISLDGGYFTENLPIKDDTFRSAAIKLSQSNVDYDPRMFGKIAAYFVTSKDYNNPLEEQAPYPKEFKKNGYDDYTLGMLSHQGAEYGWFHADPWYAISVATHDRDLSYDKAEYDSKVADHKQGKLVIDAALNKAAEFRKNPPKLASKGRVNRT